MMVLIRAALALDFCCLLPHLNEQYLYQVFCSFLPVRYYLNKRYGKLRMRSLKNEIFH